MQLLQIHKVSILYSLLFLIGPISVFAQQSGTIGIDNYPDDGYFNELIDFLKEIPPVSGKLRFGPLEISPTLEISETFDDNVFNAPNDKVGDFYNTYEPGIILELPFKRHSIAIDYHTQINDYTRNYTRAQKQDNVRQSLKGSLNLNFKNGFGISFSNQIKTRSLAGGVFERRENPLVISNDENVPDDDAEPPEEFGINLIIEKRNITTNIAKLQIDFPVYINHFDFNLHYTNWDVSYQRASRDNNEHNDDSLGATIKYEPHKNVKIKTGFDYEIVRYDSDKNKDSTIRRIPFNISWQTTAKSKFFLHTRFNMRDYGSNSNFKNYSGYDATLGYKFNISGKDKLTVKFERSLKEQKFRSEQKVVQRNIVTVGDDNPYFFTQLNIDYVHRFSKRLSFTFSPYIQTLRFKEKVHVNGENRGVISLPREKVDAVGIDYEGPI